jgi:two-component sensor histidine kinase
VFGAHLTWRDAERDALDELRHEREVAHLAYGASVDAAAGFLAAMGAALAPLPHVSATCSILAEGQGGTGVTLMLLDATGRPRCGTGEDASAGPWFTALRDGAATSLAAGRAGPRLARALREHDRLQGVLVAELSLSAQPGQLRHWLLDESGRLVPLSPGAEALSLPDRLPSEAEFSLTARDGTQLTVIRSVLRPGLHLLVAQPSAPTRMAALRHALWHAAEMAALLALAAAAVWLGVLRLVTQPLAQLAETIRRWRELGEPMPAADPQGMPEEIRTLSASLREGAAALSTREAELRAAIERGELLAAEIHHRVKNNFQVVASLLALQAGRIAEPVARAEFEAARDRIGALATLHRHMYVHHDPDAIDLGAFIRELGMQLFAAAGERPGRRIQLEVEAPALRLSSDQAVPLTLIITEAITNALKHAFPGTRRGAIQIRVTAEGTRASLLVSHDGVGPGEGAKPGLGSTLLSGLARQLGGKLDRQDGAAGSRLLLDFLLTPPLARPMLPVRPSSPG